jgi:hypothetical protein
MERPQSTEIAFAFAQPSLHFRTHARKSFCAFKLMMALILNDF